MNAKFLAVDLKILRRVSSATCPILSNKLGEVRISLHELPRFVILHEIACRKSKTKKPVMMSFTDH